MNRATPKRFGTLLRELREKEMITLRSVAKKLGWSASYLCDIELNRRRPPSREKISEIAATLKVDGTELMDLAEMENNVIKLAVDQSNERQRRVGLSLARHWDHLPSDKLEEIDRILNDSSEDRIEE